MWFRVTVVLVLGGLLAGCGDDAPTFDVSTPGMVWSGTYQVPWDGVKALAVGGPGLVVIGEDSTGGRSRSAVWVSADGVDWTRISDDEAVFGGPDALMSINAVAAGGPGLVAVGEVVTPPSYADGLVWVSADGYDWTRIEDEDLRGSWLNDVTAGGPGLVAVGRGSWRGGTTPSVWVSADGYDWTRIEDEAVFGGGGEIRTVTAGGPGLVALGNLHGVDGSSVWLSVDGYAWTRVDDQPVGLMVEVIAGGPGLVAVGTVADIFDYDDPSDALVAVSTDGYTWTEVENKSAFKGQGINAVTVGGPGLVAVGSAVWLSADGYSWARLDDSPGGLVSVVAFKGGLVAAGRGALWVSPPPGS